MKGESCVLPLAGRVMMTMVTIKLVFTEHPLCQVPHWALATVRFDLPHRVAICKWVCIDTWHFVALVLGPGGGGCPGEGAFLSIPRPPQVPSGLWNGNTVGVPHHVLSKGRMTRRYASHVSSPSPRPLDVG